MSKCDAPDLSTVAVKQRLWRAVTPTTVRRDIAHGRVMVSRLGTNSVQRDYQEHLPRRVAIGDVVTALADPAKECSENRLDDVFYTRISASAWNNAV